MTLKVFVQGLSRVFFEVSACDAYGMCAAIRQRNHELSAAHNGLLKLADLVALGQIRIKVVLAIEHGALADLRAHTQPEHNSKEYIFSIQHGQHTRHCQIDRVGLCIRWRAKGCGTTGKNLRLCGQLQVDFQPNHHFPTHAAVS